MALPGDSCGFMMIFYVLLVLGAKISGSHYNPAVTLAFMFRKDTGRFSRYLGFAYFVAQFLGAWCGSLTAWLLEGSTDNVKLRLDESKYIPSAIVTEIIGTMFLTFMYLT